MNKKIDQRQMIDFAVGGQALIEGVMMRSPNFVTVAVRKNKGDIKLKKDDFISICMKFRFMGIPFLRGVVNLFEMMIVGMKMLNYSASELMDEPEEIVTDKKGMGQKMAHYFSFFISLAFALGMSLFLFKFVPLWITDTLSKKIVLIDKNFLLYNAIDGVIKTILFISYIGLLGLGKQLQRVFQYHGAEHKSIYTYEQGLDLTVENARKMTRFHPRCGTSFILVVFLISIFVYTFVPRQSTFLLTFAVRVLFLPLIAGISYELLKWSAKKQQNFFVRMIITPGLWFQRLTTREPDDQQLEVALAALKHALELEEERQAKRALHPKYPQTYQL